MHDGEHDEPSPGDEQGGESAYVQGDITDTAPDDPADPPADDYGDPASAKKSLTCCPDPESAKKTMTCCPDDDGATYEDGG